MATDLDALLRAVRNLIPQTKEEKKEEPEKKRAPKSKKSEPVTAEESTPSKKGVHICLDLGNDTIKVAYAYDEGAGVVYGKLTKRDLINQFALPSVAFYDKAKKKWLYADQVSGNAETEFTTVVKVKWLISLLNGRRKPKNSDGGKANYEYYEKDYEFPKFYFPVKREAQSYFYDMVRKQMTFTANCTPKAACRGFFAYVKEVVDNELEQLYSARALKDRSIARISVVYPQNATTYYIDELTSLIEETFGQKPEKAMSTTRALSLLAYHRGNLKKGESALVFDMGDETLSVVKASVDLKEGKVCVIVDGSDGHSLPIALGGGDVDEAVENYLESAIHNRETVGTPSAGSDGHIYEFGLDKKQYLLLKEIKKAKTILSKPLHERSLFKNGVPISLYRDLHVQRKLTHDEFKDIVGVKSGSGVAQRILSYILGELSRPLNREVKKVFIAGGLVETLGLVDYLKAEIKRKFSKVEILSFDDNVRSDDEAQIQSYEDSIYAASVGGAIVSLKNYEIKMALSYSYGTWVTLPSDPTNSKHFMIAAERGTVIGDNGATFLTKQPISAKAGCNHIAGEEFYSLILTDAQIQSRQNSSLSYTAFSGNWYLKVGKTGDSTRKAVVRETDFKVVSGEKGGKILIKYQGRQVTLGEPVYFYEGFEVDRNGRATPCIVNARSENAGRISVTYRGGTTVRVNASDITFEFEGIDDIDMEVN